MPGSWEGLSNDRGCPTDEGVTGVEGVEARELGWEYWDDSSKSTSK